MKFENTGSEVKEVAKTPEAGGYKDIKPESATNFQQSRSFWDKLFGAETSADTSSSMKAGKGEELKSGEKPIEPPTARTEEIPEGDRSMEQVDAKGLPGSEAHSPEILNAEDQDASENGKKDPEAGDQAEDEKNLEQREASIDAKQPKGVKSEQSPSSLEKQESTTDTKQPESANGTEVSKGQVFSNLDDMKSRLEKTYKEIKESKPMNSPNIEKWFEKGGKIEISEQDGKQVWTYINPEGVAVKYVDGYPVFPPETKHPEIGDLSIGEFTGDRKEDKELYLQVLEEEYGLTEIPEGYVLHHDSENGTMQLVKEEYHKEFTHAGGHSKFKENV